MQKPAERIYISQVVFFLATVAVIFALLLYANPSVPNAKPEAQQKALQAFSLGRFQALKGNLTSPKRDKQTQNKLGRGFQLSR